MDAFYQTVAAFCFTLLGLWWAVVQFRHAEWMNNLRQRRAAYSVHLSFLVPGIMSLGAMIAGDVKSFGGSCSSWRAGSAFSP